MKKIIGIFTIITLIALFFFTQTSYAVALDAINIQTDKQIVRPAEEVKLTINFGQELGAYTFDISYDNKIFDYIGVEGGTANDMSDKVRVTYYDQTGGSNPRTSMNVTFKAKDDITTSNPTEFTVTAEGLSNPDASVIYDDITVPIVKNLTVEPAYVDYAFKLQYTGDIIREEEKEMTLSYFSSMGRYYEHARLVAEASSPQGASVKLLATDQAGLEHDIIQSGFGDAQGYKIGGKDVSQILQTRAIFSDVGEYTINFKLIDRDNSDNIIAQESFKFTVTETPAQVTPPNNTENVETQVPENETITKEEVEKEEVPTKLPKTGENIYIPFVAVLALSVGAYVFYNKKK